MEALEVLLTTAVILLVAHPLPILRQIDMVAPRALMPDPVFLAVLVVWEIATAVAAEVDREATSLPVLVPPEVLPEAVQDTEQVIPVWVGEAPGQAAIPQGFSTEELTISPIQLRPHQRSDILGLITPCLLKEPSHPPLGEEPSRAMEPRITSQDPDTSITLKNLKKLTRVYYCLLPTPMYIYFYLAM